MVFALSILLGTMVSTVSGTYNNLVDMYKSRTQYMRATAMSEALEQFYTENGAFPASIATLGTASGFQQTRSLTDSWQGYGVSPAISDGTWQFTRMVFLSNDLSKGIDATAYLSANSCGAGGYATASSWCGSATGKWFRRETRENFTNQMGTQRVRMGRLLQKLGDFYNTYGKFPEKDSGGNFATNDIRTIASLVGFGGTAATCSGTFVYSLTASLGVPVDCGDMYDLWGQPVGYQFISTKHIVLVSEPPIFNASGNRVVIAADFDNSLI